MSHTHSRLNAAPRGPLRIERELGKGGGRTRTGGFDPTDPEPVPEFEFDQALPD